MTKVASGHISWSPDYTSPPARLRTTFISREEQEAINRSHEQIKDSFRATIADLRSELSSARATSRLTIHRLVKEKEELQQRLAQLEDLDRIKDLLVEASTRIVAASSDKIKRLEGRD